MVLGWTGCSLVAHRFHEVQTPMGVTHPLWLAAMCRQTTAPTGRQLNRLNGGSGSATALPRSIETVRMITVAVAASAVDKGSREWCSSPACLVCGSSEGHLPDALIAHDHLNRQGSMP